MTEEWRDIKGYEGYYQVSNAGRVRSLDRYVNSKFNNKILRKGSLMKLQKSHKGYMVIILHKEGTIKTFQVHRLVATAFIPNPHNLPQVNHIDTDKTNNKPENLEWITNEDNMAHAISHGCFKPFTKKQYESVAKNLAIAHKKQNIPVVQLDKDGKYISEYGSILEASRSLGLQNGKISMCCKGKRNSCGGFRWKYKEEYINEHSDIDRKAC